MSDVQKAIFPAVLTGIVLVFLISRWIAAPIVVQAATAEAPAPPAPQAAAIPVTGQSEEQGGCSLSADYPESIRQWCGLIEQAAQQHGLEPGLIAAVMLQESGGDAQAYSHSGAVGLLQVMPRDGLAASFICASGSPCFANRPSMDELFDPAFNIDYGARMLAGLAERRGSLRDGLYAYGPMDVGYSYADKVLAIFESRR